MLFAYNMFLQEYKSNQRRYAIGQSMVKDTAENLR